MIRTGISCSRRQRHRRSFSNDISQSNGVDAFQGQQWSTVFSRVKSRFSYFKDDGANRLITTHLDNLLGEIESLPVIITPSPAQVPAPAHTKDEQIELLKEQLAASRAENEELRKEAQHLRETDI